ncbi:MAG: hypothetical protein ACLTMP_07855 [Eggerthella lenta]
MLRLNCRPVFDDQGVPLDADAIGAAHHGRGRVRHAPQNAVELLQTYFAGRARKEPPSSPGSQLFERAGIDPRLRGEVLDLPSSSASAALSSRSGERFGR